MAKNINTSNVNSKDDRAKIQPKPAAPYAAQPKNQGAELTDEDLDRVSGGGAKYQHNETLVVVR